MGEDGTWIHLLTLLLLRVLSWIIAAVGAWMLYSTWKFLAAAEKRTGKVVEVHKSISINRSPRRGRSGPAVITYRPVFEYPGEGGAFERAETATYSTRFDFAVGSEHEILINPAAPGKAWMPGAGNYLIGAVLLGIGLIFGILGIFAPF